MEQKSINFEIKNFEEGQISGYASTFGFPADRQGDVIVKGAFSETIKTINAGGIPLLDTHKQDSESVLGTVISAKEDSHGLYITARLADTPRVQEIRAKMKQGHINRMSIGFFIQEEEFKKVDKQTYRFIKKADVIEISVVPIPANPRAEILAVKQQSCDPVIYNEDQIKESVSAREVIAKMQNETEVENSQAENNVSVNPTLTESKDSCCGCGGCDKQKHEDGARASVTESAPSAKCEGLRLLGSALQSEFDITKRKLNHGQ